MCYRILSWVVAGLGLIALGAGTARPAATYYLSPTGAAPREAGRLAAGLWRD